MQPLPPAVAAFSTYGCRRDALLVSQQHVGGAMKHALAAHRGDTVVVRALVAAGADIDRKNSYGESALTLCCNSGLEESQTRFSDLNICFARISAFHKKSAIHMTVTLPNPQKKKRIKTPLTIDP